MATNPEHETFLRKLADPRYYGEQDKNGVDLSLIRESLKLSVEQRLAKASRARKSALRLREIGRQARTN